MSGVKDDVGIIPLAIDTVFAAIDEVSTHARLLDPPRLTCGSD